MSSNLDHGLRLSYALTRFAKSEHLQLAANLEQLESVSQFGPATFRPVRIVLLEGLIQRMSAGELQAHGIKHGETSQSLINPSFFLGALIDYEANTIKNAGVVYHAVHIRRAPGAIAVGRRPKIAQAVVDGWMRANAKVGSKRDQTLKDCMQVTGCTAAQARTAWSVLPVEIKGTRGSKKS